MKRSDYNSFGKSEFQLKQQRVPKVNNQLQDFFAWLSSPSYDNFIQMYANFYWYVLSPFIGGYISAYTYDQYKQRQVLFDLLGINQLELYGIGIKQAKDEYSKFFGYQNAAYAKYQRPVPGEEDEPDDQIPF
eukprot:403372771